MQQATTAMVRRGVVLVVVAALWAATGCGGDDSGESTGAEVTPTTSFEGSSTTSASTGGDDGPTDVCALLDDAAVSEVAGVDVTSTSLNDATGAYGVCEWGVAEEGYYRVRLTVGPADLYEVLRSNQATPLEGLGDEAWSYQYGANGDKLDIGVLVGDDNLLVFFDPIADPAAGQALVQSAIDALGS